MRQINQFFGVGESLKARTIRGTALSLVGFGGSQMIRLISNLILTRILFPEAFGLMALIQVILMGLGMFSDFSIRRSIIRSERGDDPEFLNTAWTIQIIRGVVIWLGACVLSAPIARFYEQDMLAQMIPVLGLAPLIAGFESTKMAQVNRHLKLGFLTLVELGAQFLGTIIMILLVVWLRSVWALVFGVLVINVLRAIMSHALIPGLPNRFAWDKTVLWEMFHFGKYLFFGTVAGFFLYQGDRLILGKFIELDALAIYFIAYLFASVPQTLNNFLVERILLPLYRNRPPAESRANRRSIGQARRLIVGGLLGIATIIALGGEFIISNLYDSRYHGAGIILVLLSLAIMPKIIVGGYSRILLANGDSRNFTILTIVSAFFTIALLLFLISNYGIMGAILAPFIVDLAVYPLLIYFTRRYGGWYPVQDLCFVGVALFIGTLALWNNPASLQQLVEFSRALVFW